VHFMFSLYNKSWKPTLTHTQASSRVKAVITYLTRSFWGTLGYFYCPSYFTKWIASPHILCLCLGRTNSH
jgi:hypothetical protein